MLSVAWVVWWLNTVKCTFANSGQMGLLSKPLWPEHLQKNILLYSLNHQTTHAPLNILIYFSSLLSWTMSRTIFERLSSILGKKKNLKMLWKDSFGRYVWIPILFKHRNISTTRVCKYPILTVKKLLRVDTVSYIFRGV